ncbi:MAG TPA: hypothetical protein VMU80_23255 [Bryobacteraceae bacterium]|nr:hypothetical protein [Bryobacteraceae bacterium]
MSNSSSTRRTASAGAWPWPEELDAVAAAPQYHRIVLENDHVRVLDTRIPAGEIVPVHTHRWPAVYYTIVAGDFIRRDQEGKILFDSRSVPGLLTTQEGTWMECLPPHSVENVSGREIHLISVELKDS